MTRTKTGSPWWRTGRVVDSTTADPDIVALRYDEEAAAVDLAAWCDGQVVVTEDLEGRQATTIYVPTSRGPLPALPGDWIVRLSEGAFRPMSPADFAARYQPQPG